LYIKTSQGIVDWIEFHHSIQLFVAVDYTAPHQAIDLHHFCLKKWEYVHVIYGGSMAVMTD